MRTPTQRACSTPPVRPHILVLGAGGSVGRAIIEAVAADPGLVAVAGMRRPAPLRAGVASRLVDATDEAANARALDGITHVVNAVGGPPSQALRVTEAVCAAVSRQGRGTVRLVHLSSMAVYGPATGAVAETAPLFAQTPYAVAKIACEVAVRGGMEAGLDAVILRPGVVYGPGSAQWTRRIARLLRARRLGDLGAAGDGLCNLIHERDLAAAVIAACLRPQAAGGAFNLATPAPPTWNEYFVALARALGATPVHRIGARRLALEARLAAPALRLAGPLLARLGRVPDAITPSLLRLFAQRIRLDPGRADAVLGFTRTPDRDGIAALATA